MQAKLRRAQDHLAKRWMSAADHRKSTDILRDLVREISGGRQNMGLWASHMGPMSYRRFRHVREVVAHAAGMPPLRLMDGYLGDEVVAFGHPRNDGTEHCGQPGSFVQLAGVVVGGLPIRWNAFASDDLCFLLREPDNGGVIEADKCVAVAKRLNEVMPNIPSACADLGMEMRVPTDVQILFEGIARAAQLKEDFSWG